MSTTSSAPARIVRRLPRLGEFKGTVSLISVIPSTEKPVIFTRIDLPAVPATDSTAEIPAEQVTHAVRLNNVDSVRIGLDEIRGAFPELVGKNNEETLMALMTQTDSFIGRQISVGIEPQINKSTNVQQKDNNGNPYFNVRLRSSLRNIAEDKARSIALAMLSAASDTSHLDHAFNEG